MAKLTKVFIILSIFFLTNCSTDKTFIISTNQFIQQNYDYNCLETNKTFTEIILCYQLQDKAEKEQNVLTNELINR